MQRYIQTYRSLIDSSDVPEDIKSQAEANARTFFNEAFKSRHVRLDKYRVRITDDFVAQLWLDWQDYTDALYLVSRTWEKPNVEFVKSVLKPGDTVMDAGANIGYFSLLMSHCVGPSGKVVAIEPLKRNIYVLQKNIDSNKAANISLTPCALGLKSGQTKLKYRFLNSGSPSTHDFFGKDPIVDLYLLEEQVEVKTFTQVSAESNVKTWKLIKADLQGAECEFVESLQTALSEKTIEYIIIEYNPQAYSGKDIRPLFSEFGYKANEILEGGKLLQIADNQALTAKRDYVFRL